MEKRKRENQSFELGMEVRPRSQVAAEWGGEKPRGSRLRTEAGGLREWLSPKVHTVLIGARAGSQHRQALTTCHSNSRASNAIFQPLRPHVDKTIHAHT